MFCTDADMVVCNEFIVKSCVWDLHCIWRRHVSKVDRFLPDVYYVKVTTCVGHVILIDMGIKKSCVFCLVRSRWRALRMASDVPNEFAWRVIFTVIAVVEAGGGDFERLNEALKEGGRSCVSSVGKVAPQ